MSEEKRRGLLILPAGKGKRSLWYGGKSWLGFARRWRMAPGEKKREKRGVSGCPGKKSPDPAVKRTGSRGNILARGGGKDNRFVAKDRKRSTFSIKLSLGKGGGKGLSWTA